MKNKRIISLLLAVITVFNLCIFGPLPIFAEGEDTSVIGATARLSPSAPFPLNLYSAMSYDQGPLAPTIRVYDGDLPETFKILDVMTVSYGTVFYKIGTVDGSSHEILDTYFWIKAVLVEILPEVKTYPPEITLYGQTIKELDLYEGSKLPLKAKMPAEAMDLENLTWSWQVMADGKWITIADKVTDTCDVTYALMCNILDENGRAEIRSIATEGELQHCSEPVTVQMHYEPKATEPFYANSGLMMEATPNLMLADGAGEDEETINIIVRYIKIRPDYRVGDEAIYIQTESFSEAPLSYETFSIPLPVEPGYYPVAPTLRSDVSDEPAPYVPDPDKQGTDFANYPKDESLVELQIPAGMYTSSVIINVYYYPRQGRFEVHHYLQATDSDEYELYTITTPSSTVDAPIPETCHLDLTGFKHLRYERTEVASDGSTIIKIQYDREYFSIIFHLVHDYAYGQESLYVRYNTRVGVRDAKCVGYAFAGWDKNINGEYDEKIEINNGDLEPGAANWVYVTQKTEFKALWTSGGTSYKVVYWLENPNDGNYSVWYDQKVEKMPSGDLVLSGLSLYYDNGTDGDIKSLYVDNLPADKIPNYKEYSPFVTWNATKTKEAAKTVTNPTTGEAVDYVIVEGDGSTTVNIYFNRRVYNISFLARPDPTLNHNHDTEPCQFAPIYCTDPTHTSHVHSNDCGALKCSETEHKHTAECCETHMHGPNCYTVDSDMKDSIGEIVTPLVQADVKNKYGSIGGTILNWILGESTTTAATNAGAALSAAAPPQNLQNGYVYILTGVKVPYSNADHWTSYIGKVSGEVEMSVPAIYIDGEWYYYNGKKEDGDIEPATCSNPDHDHTSGCTYGNTCKLNEHVHTSACFDTCNDTSAQHTAACYGNVCTIPVYNPSFKDENAGINGDYTVFQLQAKYGQDIAQYLPYYLELQEYGLHQNASGQSFTAWQYAGTGHAQSNAKTRYVKHVTMEAGLCYSKGVTAKGLYESNTKEYSLYYLFESLDSSSAAIAYGTDGSARQTHDGNWYDSDPVHYQLIQLPESAVATFEQEAIEKEIHGMHRYVGSTANPNVDGNRYAHFYDRNADGDLVFYYGAQELKRVEKSYLKYGVPLGEIADFLRTNSNFDVDKVPYPEGLEPDAYYFDGWYTTPYKSNYTKVDWNTDVMSADTMELYAIWEPVLYEIRIYDDANKDVLLSQQYIPHRSPAAKIDIAEQFPNNRYVVGGYQFAEWFYWDADSSELRSFNFESMVVTQEMELYATWSSDTAVSYEIHYRLIDKDGNPVLDENGNPVAVANSVYGTAYAGQNRTFRAATGSALYGEYQEGCFPLVGSHTLQMTPHGSNVYVFEYKMVEKLSYTIRFVDEFGNPFDPNEVNPHSTTGAKYPAPITEETSKAMVTRRFIPIEGYTVDRYSQTLILSAEGENVITFTYTVVPEDVEKPPVYWVVVHWKEQASGGYLSETETYQDPEGSNCIAHVKDFLSEGYEFKGRVEITTRELDENGKEIVRTIPQNEWIQDLDPGQYGCKQTSFGVEINLYYERIYVGYTIRYLDQKDSSILKEIIIPATSSKKFGETVTVSVDARPEIDLDLIARGYALVSRRETAITLTRSEAQNVIVFEYQQRDQTFNYKVVCDDPNAGVLMDPSFEITKSNPTGSDYVPQGSVPVESLTYYFAGWFADEACTQPITNETIAQKGYQVALGENNRLTPTRTPSGYTDANGVVQNINLYVGADYFALFLPRSASLTLTVNSGNHDSFILTLVGQEGSFAAGKTITVALIDGESLTITDMPVGSYTVTSNTDWSWRYPQINATATVAVSVGGSLTIDLSVADGKDQWLTDTDHGDLIQQNGAS